MHLMAVNIWTWFRFILIKYTFKNNKKYSYSHLTVEEILSDQNYTSTKSSGELLTYEYFGNITTLFVTCIVEYSVIGAAVMFVMWKTIDQESHHENQIIYQEPHHENQSIVKKRTVFNVDFSSSFEGLFIGVLFMTSSFVSIGIYLYFYQNDPQAATLTYRISDCILLSFALVGCIIGLYRIRLLQYGHLHQSKSEVVDEILLFESIKQKPGKQVVTFIMIANISLFIFHNLEEMNSVLGDAMENKQAKPYVVLTSIMSPFVIFYRFHSSVCLAEIWKICYNIRVNYKGKNENTACNIERRDRDTNGSTATISTVFMKV
ncbi:hypothetical protein FO519_009102 [Halicephalobus sp. NKZ332]|nr:hypothetical protein FO519_009102 [Halicephalobus sp. NKZ332]